MFCYFLFFFHPVAGASLELGLIEVPERLQFCRVAGLFIKLLGVDYFRNQNVNRLLWLWHGVGHGLRLVLELKNDGLHSLLYRPERSFEIIGFAFGAL